MFFNEVKINGRLVKNTEVVSNKNISGKTYKMSTSTIMHTEHFGDNTTYDYFDLIAFNDAGEKLSTLYKGDYVVVSGKLSNSQYTDKLSGKKITRTRIVVEKVEQYIPNWKQSDSVTKQECASNENSNASSGNSDATPNSADKNDADIVDVQKTVSKKTSKKSR